MKPLTAQLIRHCDRQPHCVYLAIKTAVYARLLQTSVKPVLLAVMLLCLTACVPLPARPSPTPPKVPVELSTAQVRLINQLLDSAEINLSNNQLTSPADNNAVSRYRLVLELDPDNSLAKTGLERAAEKYLALATRAAQRKQYSLAFEYIAKSRELNRSNANIDAIIREVEYLQTTRLQQYRINAAALKQQRDELSNRLQQWGRKAKQNQARCTIYAPSDASIRWIYQQMNLAPGPLLQAQIEYQSPARIEIRY